MGFKTTLVLLAFTHSVLLALAQPAATEAYHMTSSSEHLQVTTHDNWGGDHLLGKTVYPMPASGPGLMGGQFQLDRVAADGSVVWSNEYACGLLTRLGHVEPVSEGDELLAVGGFVDWNGSNERAFVMRIDAVTGAVLDQITFTWTGINGLLNSRFLHADEIPDGGYYLAGWYGEMNVKSSSKHAWVLKLTDAFTVDWQRSTESISYDTANQYDWDMANHVVTLADGGAVVSGSLNAGPEAATPNQSGLAWRLDSSGNTEWFNAAEFQSGAGAGRIVAVGAIERNGMIVQAMNHMQDLAFSLRVLDPNDGGEMAAEKFNFATTPGGGKPRAFELDLLPSGDLLVAGYVKDHVWEKLDTLGNPSGVMVNGNVPFVWRAQLTADNAFVPTDFTIFPDDATNAGEHSGDPFVSAFSPSNMSYIYYPDMCASVSDADRSLTGYRNQWNPNFSDQTWIPAPAASTPACEVQTEPTVALPPDWSPGQQPTLETSGPQPEDLVVVVTATAPARLDCGETGTPDCNPDYTISHSYECLDANFTAVPATGATLASDMQFQWTTSDGGFGAGTTFAHTFPGPGVYDVTLSMACVWSPSVITTVTESVTILLTPDCIEEPEPCELLFPYLNDVEQVSCGFIPVVEVQWVFFDTGSASASSCVEWYVDGDLHDGPNDAGQINLPFGPHTLCLRVSCCDDPSQFREDCEEINVGLCPEYTGELAFNVSSPGVGGSAFCPGCMKTLEIPSAVTADLENCQALYWDFSWSTTGEIPAADMTVCVPTLPIAQEACLVLRCEPPGLEGSGITPEIDRICQPLSCWFLDGPLIDWSPEIIAEPAAVGTGMRFSIAEPSDAFDTPYALRIAERGWWGGPAMLPQQPLPVPYPALMMDFGWAVVKTATGEPVTRAEGSTSLELASFGTDETLVFVVSTPQGVFQYAFQPEPFSAADTTCTEDLDGDGTVGVNDLLQLLSGFGDNCE